MSIGNTRQPNEKKPIFSNQILMILIGVLSIVLVALLIVSGSLFTPDANPDPTNPQLGSNPASTPSSSQMPSSSATQPSATLPPSIPTTAPITVPTLPPAPPEGGKYINVGYGHLVEVIQPNVETFDGGKYDDFSHPTNNYLPEGTVDYCAKDIVYGSGMKYVQLRSGHRVYFDKKVYPFPTGDVYQMVDEVKMSEGWLPDHNEVGVSSFEIVGHHTVLTMDTMWKAPFYFETNQSGYANPVSAKDRDYEVVHVNATYIDITFCYSTVFNGTITIPSGHPLFRSAQIIKNEYDYTLRLYLRKTGGFYGWHAYYNDNDQLCFIFLNPTKVTAAENKYGADLTGTKIMLDVGHGGIDGGAAAYYCATCDKDLMASDLKNYSKCRTCNTKAQLVATETELNMALALALKAELESVGATVILNRTEDTIINVNDRQEQLHEIAPDICIAIHQNSNDSKSTKGFFSMFFTTWSQSLAQHIRLRTRASEVYSRSVLQWSANYFMTRQPICPVVLTENGFMSNETDLTNMLDEVVVQNKAIAIAQGIADYFLEINQ